MQLCLSQEVAYAINNNIAVVALESTIISHGMPYPQNLQTAIKIEDICRANNVVPATIAILDGVVKVGLNNNELEKLAKLGKKCRKVSRRDLAVVVSQKWNGATTVAATMYIASLAGISVFVTGGVGGVHRGAETTMDISADLIELGRTPVAVVSAGVKSILDIPKTLEVLETQGVSVVTVGNNEFPAFFTRHSGCQSPLMLNTPLECAKLIKANKELKLSSGMLFAVPIPEKEEADSHEITIAIKQALKEADDQKIIGRYITPFLLKRVNELTQGRSLKSNISLVMNNCRMGCQIALEYSKLHQNIHHLSSSSSSSSSSSINKVNNNNNNNNNRVIIFGATNRDLIGKPYDKLLMRTSNPGSIQKTWGGVGRNIAECLCRLGQETCFVTVVGRDEYGNSFKHHAKTLGMETILIPTAESTSIFSAILDENGDLFTTIADMSAIDDLTPSNISSKFVDQSNMVILDANIPAKTIQYIAQLASDRHIDVWFEATAVVKASKVWSSIENKLITHLSCNVEELITIMSNYKSNISQNRLFNNHKKRETSTDYMKFAKRYERLSIEQIKPLMQTLIDKYNLKFIVVTRGEHGAVAMWRNNEITRFVSVPSLPTRVINTTGAGDSMVGGIIWSLLQNYSVEQSLQIGQWCASLTLQTHNAVSEQIDADSVPLPLLTSKL